MPRPYSPAGRTDQVGQEPEEEPDAKGNLKGLRCVEGPELVGADQVVEGISRMKISKKLGVGPARQEIQVQGRLDLPVHVAEGVRTSSGHWA